MARKRLMRWALCMGLVLSMTATQPLAAIAAANENRAMGVQEISPEGVTDPEADTDKEESSSSENEVTQGGQGKKTEQSVTPEENDTDGASEERDKNGDGQRQTVEESADSFGSSNLAGESIQPRISVATNLTDPNQTEGDGCYTIPVTTVPNLKDGTYTVPMRMFKIIGSSDAHAGETTEGFGNPKYAPSSLGSMALDPLDSETQMSEATVTVSGGKVKVAIGLNQTLGCTAFNYYDSYEGFQDGDRRGGTPEDPDGIEYEGGKEVTEWNPDGDVFCIKKANFELPSDNPIVYITVEATGMPGQPQDAFLGFYWDYIEGDQTESVDKTALNEEIQKAEGMLADTEEDYTLKSRADLQKYIDAAREVSGNGDATEEEVQKAVENLQKYEGKLVSRKALGEALKEVARVRAEAENYTQVSMEIYNLEAADAQATYDKTTTVSARLIEMAVEDLAEAKAGLVSRTDYGRNALRDGTYTVPVNLWDSSKDKESMGNSFINHVADLAVKDGKYTLTMKAPWSSLAKMETLKIVEDGGEPLEDGSNYTELANRGNEEVGYLYDIDLKNVGNLTDAYYAQLKITMMPKAMAVTLRVSWDGVQAVSLDEADKTALNEEIQKAEGILADTEEDYTLKSRADLQKYIDAAREVSGNGDATEEEVQKAVENLQKYEGKLVSRKALGEALKEVARVRAEAENYTQVSMEIYNLEAADAQATYDKTTTVSARLIEMAVEDLAEAKAGLVSRTDYGRNALRDGTYTVPVNLWDSSKDKESMGNSFINHVADLAVKDGKYILTMKAPWNNLASMETLKIVADGTKPAEDGSNYTELVNRGSESEGYIYDVELKNMGALTDSYYAQLKVTMMPRAMEVILRVSWDGVQVVSLDEADKTALNEEIQKAEGMLADTEEDYTLKSKADLQTCIDTAKGVAGNRDATEEEVQKAVEDLQEYEKSLVTRRNLAQALRDARTESGKTEVYTSDSMKALENQIEKAQAVYDQEDPTQAEVDQAAEDLRRVQGELERLPAEEPETYPAFHAVDSVTGVELAAAEGVLPEGVKMRVVKVTDADKAKEISSALSNLADKNTAYEITLYVERDGKEESVDPKEDMSLTITLPVPEGYNVSKVACYYIDANQYANTVKGTLSGTKYTVSTDKLGIYAVAQKKTTGGNPTVVKPTGTTTPTPKPTAKTTVKPSTSTTKSGGTTTTTKKSGTTSTGSIAKNVKTGDETNMSLYLSAGLMALMAGAGAVVVRRRKR